MRGRARAWIATVLVAAAVGAFWARDGALARPELDRPAPYDDMVALDSLIRKSEDPSLYPTDYLYGHEGAASFYTPSYRILLGLVGGATWKDGLTRLAPLLAFVYVITMTALLRRFTRRTWLAVTIAAVSTLPHWALATFWGVGAIDNALPRTVFLAVAPAIVLLWLEVGDRPAGAVLVLLATGLAANLHPVSGAFLAQVFLLERGFATVRGRFRARWLPCLPVAFAAGAAPFLVSFLGASVAPAVAPPPLGLEARFAVLWDRFSHNFLPQSAFRTWRFLECAVPVALLAIPGWWVGRRRPAVMARVRHMARFLAVVVIAAVGGVLVLQLLARYAGHRFMTIDQLRGSRWIYAAGFAFATVALDALLDRLPRALRVPAVAAAAAILVPLVLVPDLVVSRRYVPRPALEAWRALRGRETPPPGPKERERDREFDALAEAARWARKHTAPDALFLTDDARFRSLASRSVAYATKDGGPCYYLGDPMFLEWARRAAIVDGARAAGRVDAWVEAARSLGCDHALVPLDSVDGAGSAPGAVFANDRYAILAVPAEEPGPGSPPGR